MLNLDFITSHRIFLLIIVSLSVSVESFTYTSDRSSVAHSSISLSGDNRFYHEISGKYRDSKIGLKRSVFGSLVTGSQLFMSEEASSEKKKRPETFREAEVYGLDLLRQGNYEDALKGPCIRVTYSKLLHYFLLEEILASIFKIQILC
uniref:Peptidylprolyl isomerase n=1 Tax=Corethron hystrix TaxID=216773 RepID=A0A6U5JMU6_9STRA|mmetsp:Transcript_37178/g.86689  ORF Transcript_37178/g.86689 Transcript_37178/m.86689 type:complete len:148 (+) Transcript_37178:139-582(+)